MRSATLFFPLAAFVLALGCSNAASEQVATDESSSAIVAADGTDDDLSTLGVAHYKIAQYDAAAGLIDLDLRDAQGTVIGTASLHTQSSTATITLRSRTATVTVDRDRDALVMSPESAPRAGLALWRTIRDPGLVKRFPAIATAFPTVHAVSFPRP